MDYNSQILKEAFLVRNEQKVPNNPIELPPDCRCYYEVLDVQVQTPPGHPDFELSLKSSLECNPGQTETCIYFSGAFFTEPVSNCGTFWPPDCVGIWPYLPPIGGVPFRHEFNCEVPAFSDFPVEFGAIWIDPGCTQADYTMANITLRVACVETCENYAFMSYTEPFTLTFHDVGTGSNPIWFGGDESAAIVIEGCGCQPVVGDYF